MASIAASALLGLSFAGTTVAGANSATILQAGNNESFVPKVIPLAVRTPYLSTWTVPGDAGSLTGGLPEPKFWNGARLGWGQAIKVDGRVCTWMGDAPFGAHDVAKTGFQLTSTQSLFSFTCGPVGFDATFLSPVEPNNYTLQSLPWSYVALNPYSNDGKAHDVSFYSDVTTQWVAFDSSFDVTWNISTSKKLGYYYGSMAMATPQVYAENQDMALWGETVWATNAAKKTVKYQSGAVGDLRAAFINGLTNKQDTDQPRRIDSNYPGIAFQVDLGKIKSVKTPLVFAIGQIRDPAVQFTALGCTKNCGRSIYARADYPTVESQLEFFLGDYANAKKRATALDKKIRTDAIAAVNEDYATIVELSTRQALGAMEITVGKDSKGHYNKSDAMVFMKEISSDGNVNTADVIFPAFPGLLYLSPNMLRDLLRPGFLYYGGHFYPNTYAGHDLGSSYPNATGHPDGKDEYMPVEESGNYLIMAFAYSVATGDLYYLKTYYDLLKQWTAYLVSDGIFPGSQVSTDDFAGPLANQTTLALKSSIGIQAMSKISTILGHKADAKNYSSEAKKAIATVQEYGMDPSKKHLMLAYNDTGTWSLIYNAYPDHLLNLSIVPQSLYKLQGAWYQSHANNYGVPLDTRHTYTKSDWEMWTAAIMPTQQSRDVFVNGLANFLKFGAMSDPLPDWYNTISGSSQGFRARPVVGGHFSFLALRALWGHTKTACEEGLTGGAPYTRPNLQYQDLRSEDLAFEHHKLQRERRQRGDF